VLVLGMHRSGTSAVAGSLHLLGLATCEPEDLMTGMPWNPAGHWESRSLSRLDDELLTEMDRSWWYPPPTGEAYAEVTGRVTTAPETAARCFRRAHPSAPWVWKDPRLSVLLPFWRRVLGEPLAAVVVHREPLDVARSLELRNGFPVSFGLALWARYNRLLLEHSRGLAVLVVRYDDVVEDPGRWVHDAASFLGACGIETQVGGARAASDFVEPIHRHLREGGPGGGPGRTRGDGDEVGERDLRLETEHLVATLRAVDGFHPSFVPPALDGEAPEVEAELASRWPDRPPVWNDPPWSPVAQARR
jgi:hypothetical protein